MTPASRIIHEDHPRDGEPAEGVQGHEAGRLVGVVPAATIKQHLEQMV